MVRQFFCFIKIILDKLVKEEYNTVQEDSCRGRLKNDGIYAKIICLIAMFAELVMRGSATFSCLRFCKS